MRTVTDAVEKKIRSWESTVLKAYLDSAGVPTIGVGHTAGVKLGQRITLDQADDLLQQDLGIAESAVDSLVHVPLNDHQFGALVSFAFNAGVGALRTSTLLKVLNAGHYDQVPHELAKYNKAHVNGHLTVLNGLTKRRQHEIDLWNKPVGPELRVPAPPTRPVIPASALPQPAPPAPVPVVVEPAPVVVPPAPIPVLPPIEPPKPAVVADAAVAQSSTSDELKSHLSWLWTKASSLDLSTDSAPIRIGQRLLKFFGIGSTVAAAVPVAADAAGHPGGFEGALHTVPVLFWYGAVMGLFAIVLLVIMWFIHMDLKLRRSGRVLPKG
jgi:lysozyme